MVGGSLAYPFILPHTNNRTMHGFHFACPWLGLLYSVWLSLALLSWAIIGLDSFRKAWPFPPVQKSWKLEAATKSVAARVQKTEADERKQWGNNIGSSSIDNAITGKQKDSTTRGIILKTINRIEKEHQWWWQHQWATAVSVQDFHHLQGVTKTTISRSWRSSSCRSDGMVAARR